MIATALARALRDSGLVWHPASGDAFRIDRSEVESDVFTVSDMTVEAHVFPTGTILGFNGTTEWALDSVSIEESVWLPREDQLRHLLRATFRTLTREVSEDGEPRYRVDVLIEGESVFFTGADAADAYGRALLALIDVSTADPDDLDPRIDDALRG